MPPQTLAPGTRLGPYEIVAPLGAGGMGEVYQATDTRLKRQVALKVLPAALTGDADRIARFQREAEVLASLNHPLIAQIYGLEDADGVRALVMELVDGPTLADRIAQGAIPLHDALLIAKQIAEAIEVAHQQGIIHRDLKPANIKVRLDGAVKLLDFGLARPFDSQSLPVGLSQSSTVTTPAMTLLGAILGTVAYMSPEQARGTPVDTATDIWAFGCVLYEMLTGHPAFAGETFSDIIAAILAGAPDWRALPVPAGNRINKLLRGCLQRERHCRLPDIAVVRSEIESALGVLERRRDKGPKRSSSLEKTVRDGARLVPSPRHDSASISLAPVSVLVADVANTTGDPVFDRALEPRIKAELERARFITTFGRAQLGIRPDDTLNEATALQLAVNRHLAVVLTLSVSNHELGYGVALKASQAITGDEIFSSMVVATGKNEVLLSATKLVTNLRTALGDSTSDSSRLFAMVDVSTGSLEAAHHYAAAQEFSTHGKFEEARHSALKAVELDPTFGVAYLILAVASNNLSQKPDADHYIREALRHLDGMTERERLSTRGMFCRLTGDYRQAVKEYTDLVERYAGDVVGHNQLAMCHIHLHSFRAAVEEMRKVVEIVPSRAIFRVNLSLYASYTGDFASGELEARVALDQGLGDWGLLALAKAQTGLGLLAQAKESYNKLSGLNAKWASSAALGLADLMIYEGRYSHAVETLDLSSAQSVTASHLLLLALAHTLQGEASLAQHAVRRALEVDKSVEFGFEAARAFVDLGLLDEAGALSTGLAEESVDNADAYSKIVEADILLKTDDPRKAIKRLAEANSLVDTWVGRFDLGRAYLKVQQFVQADSEFDRCIKRRGELLMTNRYAYLPSAYYYQGLARQGLRSAGFADSFGAYVEIRGEADEDRLLPEIRQYLVK